MRPFLCTALAALLAPAGLSAQERTLQDPDPLEMGRKEILVNQNSKNYQDAKITYLDIDKATQAKANTFNQQVDKLADERELWLARYRIYENVISLRGKDQVMAALDEARKKLGVSELEGYQRLGVHNPFSGESYIKYYDAKTGELVIGEVRQLYKNLDAARTDFEQSSNRLRAEESRISKSYQDVLDEYKAARDAKQALEKSQDDLNTARAQAAAAEAERQRLLQQQNNGLFDLGRDRVFPNRGNVLP